MATEAVIRQIGNSLGIIVPHDIVKSKGLKKNTRVFFDIVKPLDVASIFGSLKTTTSGDEFKKLVKEVWT